MSMNSVWVWHKISNVVAGNRAVAAAGGGTHHGCQTGSQNASTKVKNYITSEGGYVFDPTWTENMHQFCRQPLPAMLRRPSGELHQFTTISSSSSLTAPLFLPLSDVACSRRKSREAEQRPVGFLLGVSRRRDEEITGTTLLRRPLPFSESLCLSSPPFSHGRTSETHLGLAFLFLACRMFTKKMEAGFQNPSHPIRTYAILTILPPQLLILLF